MTRRQSRSRSHERAAIGDGSPGPWRKRLRASRLPVPREAAKYSRVFVDESRWIRQVLERQRLPSGTTVLDVGSSTLAFRTEVQPHIDQNVFAPLRARALGISHLDAREGSGIDIVADVTTLDGVRGQFDLVICANLLEHVTDRSETLRNVKNVVRPGGLLLLTVPNRYPIHHDPIDTGYRPTDAELATLIGWPEIMERTLLQVRDPHHYKNAWPLKRWLLPWRIACVLARRPL